MKQAFQIVGLIFGLGLTFFILTGCEQPAPEAEVPEAHEGNVGANVGEKIASIDADGNIAPFGFASKQPVDVPEPDAAVAAASEASAASSDIYNIHCIACHGAEAQGVQGLGLNLVDSQLVASSSQAELTAFLKVGRLPDSPDSVTGVPMPAFAWMSDAQLTDVTDYLKSLND